MEKAIKIQQLDKLYNEIAQAFCDKHDYLFEGWTGRPGSVFSAGDYFVQFDVALHDLETEQPEGMFLSWVDFILETAFDDKWMNFETFCKLNKDKKGK